MSVRRGWRSRPVRIRPAGRAGAIKRIADRLDVHPEALRVWIKRAETDEGLVPGTTSAEAARIAELEREVKELRRANAILKSASVFFAAELDRPLPVTGTGQGTQPGGRVRQLTLLTQGRLDQTDSGRLAAHRSSGDRRAT
ncbi:transposase [Streptomyces sp. NPDC003038]|uniref:transposase n=1 Tax=unclassified Streptomyces TaxID=2593676 RepID=UPI0033A425FA